MSTSAMQLATFCKEVAQSKTLWAVKDVNGFPAPAGTDGKGAMPFWPSQTRALNLISIASQFAGFEPVPISWEDFCDRWLPGLEQDGLLVGVNWVGATASGSDMHPSELKQNVEAAFG